MFVFFNECDVLFCTPHAQMLFYLHIDQTVVVFFHALPEHEEGQEEQSLTRCLSATFYGTSGCMLSCVGSYIPNKALHTSLKTSDQRTLLFAGINRASLKEIPSDHIPIKKNRLSVCPFAVWY